MITIGDYGICNLSIVPVRAAASDTAEIVTQLLFGDFVKILEKGEPWIKIKFERDDYEGWMDFKQLAYVSKEIYDEGIATRHPVLSLPILELAGPKGIQNIMLGSDLPFYEKRGTLRLGNEIYKTLISPLDPIGDPDVFELAEIYLNTPYLWGGKSIFGIDCSGLVQLIYKVCGIDLPRDAAQQQKIGTEINFGDRKAGDLAYFINGSGKIHHVGILVSAHEIVHASGCVRKDRLDEHGIYNLDLEKQTHKLHSIKRLR